MIQARCQNPPTVSSNSELNFPPRRKIVGWAGIEPALYGVTIRCHTLWLPTHFAKQNPSSLTLQLTLSIVVSVWVGVWDWSGCRRGSGRETRTPNSLIRNYLFSRQAPRPAGRPLFGAAKSLLLTLSLTLKPYMVYFSVRMSVRVKKRLRRGGRCGFRTRAPAFTDDLISSQAQ